MLVSPRLFSWSPMREFSDLSCVFSTTLLFLRNYARLSCLVSNLNAPLIYGICAHPLVKLDSLLPGRLNIAPIIADTRIGIAILSEPHAMELQTGGIAVKPISEGKIERLVTLLRSQAASQPTLAEDLRTEAHYFDDNKERMRHPK